MSEHRFERPTIFSATCNRLSQYVRENGGLGIAPLTQEPPTTQAKAKAKAKGVGVGVFRPPATMSLLPGAVVPADDSTTDGQGAVSGPKTRKSMNLFPQHAGFDDKKEADTKKAELAIFYGGEVLVFDDFSADKARDLMLMAMASVGASSANSAVVASATASASASASDTLIRKDVPIARRASLHRFLEKRKERINSKAPYQVEWLSDAGGGGSNKRGGRPDMAWPGAAASLNAGAELREQKRRPL